MLPQINGKSLLLCNQDDLRVLLDNADFRENEHIDYKQTFSFLEMPNGKERNAKINEFKSDICSFANSEGGFLIFGISDDNGCASELIGIEIPDDNTDKFELDRRNNLANILPRTPYLKFHFIKLENGRFVVIIYIKRDNFAPYVYVEDEKNYKIYKRTGNRKQIIMYSELKNMFMQSLSLEKEILSYRTNRIRYFQGQEDDSYGTYSKFLLLHIIPEHFTDTSYNENIFVLEKSQKYSFANIFSHFSCSHFSIPCVDGIRFVSTSDIGPHSEGVIFNNKIVECFFPLKLASDTSPRYPNGFLACKYLWEKIEKAIRKYVDVFDNLLDEQKVYIGISIVGCKGMATTSQEEAFINFSNSQIDRNQIVCQPVEFENTNDDEIVETVLKKLYIEFALSVGRKHDETLNRYIKDVYHNE